MFFADVAEVDPFIECVLVVFLFEDFVGHFVGSVYGAVVEEGVAFP